MELSIRYEPAMIAKADERSFHNTFRLRNGIVASAGCRHAKSPARRREDSNGHCPQEHNVPRPLKHRFKCDPKPAVEPLPARNRLQCERAGSVSTIIPAAAANNFFISIISIV